MSVLDEMVAEFERTTAGREDRAWLRPLVVLRAEIAFTVARGVRPDVAALTDECRELSDLLGRQGVQGSDFGRRYERSRGTSVRLNALHEQVLAACRATKAAQPAAA